MADAWHEPTGTAWWLGFIPQPLYRQSVPARGFGATVCHGTDPNGGGQCQCNVADTFADGFADVPRVHPVHADNQRYAIPGPGPGFPSFSFPAVQPRTADRPWEGFPVGYRLHWVTIHPPGGTQVPKPSRAREFFKPDSRNHHQHSCQYHAARAVPGNRDQWTPAVQIGR